MFHLPISTCNGNDFQRTRQLLWVVRGRVWGWVLAPIGAFLLFGEQALIGGFEKPEQYYWGHLMKGAFSPALSQKYTPGENQWVQLIFLGKDYAPAAVAAEQMPLLHLVP